MRSRIWAKDWMGLGDVDVLQIDEQTDSTGDFISTRNLHPSSAKPEQYNGGSMVVDGTCPQFGALQSAFDRSAGRRRNAPRR
jgi:hypothetical protein